MALFGLAIWGASLVFAQAVEAQESSAPVAEAPTPLTSAELEELAGPIALYPDDLVSIVLPASTYPLQIVQAARYLGEHKSNPELKPDESWDDSVVALLNYPEVVKFMSADLDWTTELGEAAIYQQPELLDAIQSFRDRAYAAGNLQSDKRQVVTKNAETIVIKPADPKVIYVPYYEPREVVVYQSYPVYYYYPRAYPVYYYPYPYGYSFGLTYFWGVGLAFSINWNSLYVNVRSPYHYSHPYYGRYYHYPRYRRHSVSVSYRENIWRPRYHSSYRQRHIVSVDRAHRRHGATSAGGGRYKAQNHQGYRSSAPNSANRVNRSNIAARGRNQPESSTRADTRQRNPREQRSGAVTRNSEDRARTRTTESTRSTAERQRSRPSQASSQPMRPQPSQARTRSGRMLGSVRPNRSSGSQSPWDTVSRQRSRPGGTVQRSAPRRQETIGNASRGNRTFGDVATRSTPSRRSGWSGSFGSSGRSVAGARSGFGTRSGPGARSGFSSRSGPSARSGFSSRSGPSARSGFSSRSGFGSRSRSSFNGRRN
ncbi:MAG: DUF3300 domain-containing protein [Gammaproteobacteria bacterium]|nr:DUF3300 domain-containing protein [Gammaproteobacteria bacterium]